MSDNPFEEDSDRTVIRPAPGGRKPAAPAAAAPPPRAAAPAASPFDSPPPPQSAPPAQSYAQSFTPAPMGEGAERIMLGGNPLIVAAGPLLQLLARLRNTNSQPDAADLRERAMREVRGFDSAARDAGIPQQQVQTANYALCASIDDVVLNTPWGSTGVWDSRSLVSAFHQEVRSGERFFQLLGQVKDQPGTYLPVLELMYICLSLGMMGRYRLSPRGPAELDKVREDLYGVIMRQRGAAEPALSPRWEGVVAPYRPARASLPVWVVAAAGLAVLGGLFTWFSGNLNSNSDDLFARLMGAPPATMPSIARIAAVVPPPPPPAPPEPGTLDKLRTFLKPEIDQGLVVVVGDENTPVVRIKGRGLFALGSDKLEARFLPILGRIGEALRQENGSVFVIGYTDNQPIRTVRFPSNFELSSARAASAKEVIGRALGDLGRIRAEGRADADPLASNATPEGREENRRIEVVLRRAG